MAANLMDLVRGSELWRDGCRMMACATCVVLRVAKEPITPENIIKFLDGLPRKSSELTTEEWQKSYCGICLEKAHAEMEEPIKRLVTDYFLRYFPDRSWTCQEMLIDSFVGILEGIPWEDLQGKAEGEA
jgi:hypothetical protein